MKQLRPRRRRMLTTVPKPRVYQNRADLGSVLYCADCGAEDSLCQCGPPPCCMMMPYPVPPPPWCGYYYNNCYHSYPPPPPVCYVYPPNYY